MPDITAIAGKVAGIVSLAAFIPYIIAILRGKGKIRPNRATWWIWTAVGFMLGASYYSSGANHTIWVPVSYIIGPFITAIISIKYGEGGWTPFDRICLLGAGISAILWWIFSSPVVALYVNIFIDLMGALPTIRKAYHEPESEDRIAWALFITGNIINLFAIETRTFTISAYPIYMFLCCGTITFLVFFRRYRKEVKK
jgi:hypothetical protein